MGNWHCKPIIGFVEAAEATIVLKLGKRSIFSMKDPGAQVFRDVEGRKWIGSLRLVIFGSPVVMYDCFPDVTIWLTSEVEKLAAEPTLMPLA